MGKVVSFFWIVFIQNFLIQASEQETNRESMQTRPKIVEDILSDRAKIFSEEEEEKIKRIITVSRRSFLGRHKNNYFKK
jgi:hypothetical protein